MSEMKVGPRLLAGLVMALVFVVGGLVGAVADRTVVLRPHARAEADPPHGDRGGPPGGRPEDRAARRERGRERFVQQMARDLNLNPRQVAQIDSITRRQNERMDSLRKAMWPRFDTVIKETRGEIDRVLTPEQRAKMKEQFRHMEERRQAGAKAPGPGTDTSSGKR